MAVRLAREVQERLLASSGAVALQVLGASDPAAATTATRLARVDLLGLIAGHGGPRPTLAPVVMAPGGPLLLIEDLDVDDEVRREIPEVLRRRLEGAGVDAATIIVADIGGSLDDLDAVPDAVVLRVFVPPGTTAIPPDWLDVAVEWLVGSGRGAGLRLRILGTEYDVAATDVEGSLHECRAAGAWCDTVAGSLDDRIRTASLTFGRVPHMALAGGGPGTGDRARLALFDGLRDAGRELAASVAYACLDLEPTFEGLAHGLPSDGWHASGGASPNEVAARLVDRFVPDVFPWQVLGPGHLDRSASAGRELDVEGLGDGRAELSIGFPEEWRPGSESRRDRRVDGFALLAPLLVAAGEDDELADPELIELDSQTSLATTSLPQLDRVIVEPAPHARRGTRLTILELASWLAHEPHTDHPKAVSPVVAAFARWLAGGLDDDDRQHLLPVAPHLVGTAGDADADMRRRWMAADWLASRAAPSWLRLAGLDEAAEHLTHLPGLTDPDGLAGAIDLLGSAATVANRRLDITRSIVGDDDESDTDEQRAWELWEWVGDSTGLVAAMEAATDGIGTELGYAADLRTVEGARDPHDRDALEAAGRPLGAAVWAAAVAAAADDAWNLGWRAADAVVRDLTGFTVRIEMGRAAKAQVPDDASHEALEQADRAGRAALAATVTVPGSRPPTALHPWDEGRNAARHSPGGTAWAVVNDEARRAVGEGAWAAAMEEARDAVGAAIAHAYEGVALAVVAALAREAAGAAARGVALRAAAVARANGSDDDGAAKAGRESLTDTADLLRGQAIALLDRIIAG